MAAGSTALCEVKVSVDERDDESDNGPGVSIDYKSLGLGSQAKISWKVELWVQPLPCWLRGWCGHRCGPWRHYATIWVDAWHQIPAAVARKETGGLYRRLLLCCEEHEHWEPVDHV